MSEWVEDCRHYYGNSGDGWLTCVKCGSTPPERRKAGKK
ncbi:hypothetical protein SEA_PETTERN_62 [Mycobacterium phage PetterN]|nr:hypothetical protein SEA_PETTERN_62 [Mycobacterium phage PetterN]